MPATTGLSSCSTVLPILPSPSARSVPRCLSDWPIWLRVCVIRSFATARLLLLLGLLLLLLRLGLLLLLLRLLRLRIFLRMPVRQNLLHRQPAHPRDVLGPAQAPQAVHRRLRHVDRVRRAEAFREDVADPGELEHRADAAAGDHARSLAGRAQQHPGGVRTPENLVRDGRPVLRHREQVLLRVLDRLRDREGNLAGLAVADADAIDLVADHDKRREREAAAALDDLGHTVDLDHAFLQLALLLARDDRALD